MFTSPFCSKYGAIIRRMFRSTVFTFLLTLSMFSFAMNDPMQPPEYMIPSGVGEKLMDSELTLQMILISPNRKYIVLNNKTVAEGDVVAGATVVSIQKERVVVKRKGKVIDLQLNSIKNRKGKDQ